MKTTMEKLGITASYSRPRVSNDNPFSEAQLRTCKYQRPVHLTFAQVLVVIDVTVAGSLAKRFQAMQQASTIAS